MKYLGRPTLPDRKTSGLFKENTARFVQFESCRIHCPCERHIFPNISFNTVLLILTKGKICWRAGAYEFLWKATMRYSSLIWMFSLTPTSAVFHSRSHSCKRSRAAERDLASLTVVFKVFGLPPKWAFLRLPFAFKKSRSFDLKMRKGSAQKMLNGYCTVLTEYLDRECERI